MDFLAKITAVGQSAAPIREGAPQGVVAPLPHEAAGVAGVIHLRSIGGGVSGAGSHRVQIFAHEVGGAANALARGVVNQRGDVRGDGDLGVGIALVEDGGDFLQGRVHARVDVRVFEGMVTLVVDDRPGTGALVDPARAGDQVHAGAGLVAEAPAHDRGMVLVAFEGADRAVHVGVGPARVVGGVIDPLPHALEPVRLDVAFEHDPQANLVGEVEQAGVGRVVRGADRVDSHGLHEGEVLACPGLVEHAPLVGTHLVAVDAVEGQGLAVGHEHAVLDGHATKTDAQAPLPRAEAFPALDADARLVEGWVLRAPRAYAAHFDATAAVATILAALERAGERPEAVDAEMPGQMSLLGTEHPGFDGHITHPGLVVGVDPQVFDGAGSEAAQAHRAEDAGQPPLVLILEVGAGAELVHAHGDPIGAGAHGLGHIELVGKARAAGHADPRPVDPHAGLACDAVETQANMTALPVGGKLKGAAVVADGVIVGRERGVDREGEVNVGVGGVAPGALAAQDPVTGHVNLGRIIGNSGLIPGLLDVDEGGGVGGVIDEVPHAVEAENPAVISKVRARGHKRARAGSIGR